MSDPLSGTLMGGPLDGGVVTVHPAPLMEIGVEGENGAMHVYIHAPVSPARMVYARTERPKATKLKGGLDTVMDRKGIP